MITIMGIAFLGISASFGYTLWLNEQVCVALESHQEAIIHLEARARALEKKLDHVASCGQEPIR